jgi:hypothetical protein
LISPIFSINFTTRRTKTRLARKRNKESITTMRAKKFRETKSNITTAQKFNNIRKNGMM